MSKLQKMVLVCLIVSAFVITSANCLSAEPIKIKGFFIGMHIDDALKNFERLGFEGLTVREKLYKKTNTVYSIQPGSGDRFLVETGFNTKTVGKIVFTGNIANRLFHTKGIGAELFQKIFADSYDILDMTVFKDNPGADPIKGWEHYNLKDGCRLRIFLNKDVEMIKINKASDFAFD